MIRKSNRVKNTKVLNATLISSLNTGHHYTISISKKNYKDFSVRKFDPIAGKHTVYRAKKISTAK